MVPSDPKTSLFPDRHARSERGIRKRRDVGPLLPAAGFARLRIEALVRARNSLSGRSPLFDTAFRSPAARAGFATRPRSRVNAPGLHLQSDPKTFPSPFGFTLPPPSGLLLDLARRVRRVKPVARFRSRISRLRPDSRSPPGPLDPSGS
jgi:hypothetical protein